MPHPFHELLNNAICNWCNGRHLTDDVRHYADTALGGWDAGTLRKALDPEQPDYETFAEFLLFPDRALHETVDRILQGELPPVAYPTTCQPECHQIEAAPHHPLPLATPQFKHLNKPQPAPGTPSCQDIAARPFGTANIVLPPFDHADADRLIRSLQATAISGTLDIHPDGRITFPIPEHLWLDIVKRLHLTVSIPQALQETIERFQPEATARFTRISLRAAYLPLHGGCLPLLTRFLQQYPCSDPEYRHALKFWLHFLSTLPVNEGNHIQTSHPHAHGEDNMTATSRDSVPETGVDAWHILHARHQRLVRGLHQSQEFSEKLQRFSMELMMMQGAQAPYIHEDDARRELRIMERVSLAVFSKALARDNDMLVVNYSPATAETDIQGMLHIVSLPDK